MPLTNVLIKQAQPKEKDFKIYDEKGLFLLVRKNGAKYWRFKYRFAGKEKSIAFGVYPEVSLKDAREYRDKARALIRDDLDPMDERKKRRFSIENAHSNDFEIIAREWFAKEKDGWAGSHIKKQLGLLENNLIPYLGQLPIREITPPILLDCLRKIEARGALETARRTKQISGQIFRYAIATGRADRDPSFDLKGALKTPQTRHFPAITEPKAFGDLLRSIDGFDGTAVVATALSPSTSPQMIIVLSKCITSANSEKDLGSFRPKNFHTLTNLDFCPGMNRPLGRGSPALLFFVLRTYSSPAL